MSLLGFENLSTDLTGRCLKNSNSSTKYTVISAEMHGSLSKQLSVPLHFISAFNKNHSLVAGKKDKCHSVFFNSLF